jgi:hypothetical protein
MIRYISIVSVILMLSQANAAENLPALTDEQTDALVSIAGATATAVFCKEYYSVVPDEINALQKTTGLPDTPAILQQVRAFVSKFLVDFTEMQKRDRFPNVTCRILWRRYGPQRLGLLECNRNVKTIVQPVCE